MNDSEVCDLNDLVLQFFSERPRSATAVYLLLTGKKTLSTLYAALEHHQLRWLHLYPTLPREEFQAAVDALIGQGRLVEKGNGLVLADVGAREQAALLWPLPRAYSPRFDLANAVARLRLGIQVVSEARYHNARYRPVTNQYATQQWVRRWYRQLGGHQLTFVTELTTALSMLQNETATELMNQIVAHGYVGEAVVDDDSTYRSVAVWSELLATIAAHPEWTALTALWGGPVDPLPARNQEACRLIEAGVSREGLPQKLRVRPSTVNEYILIATIFGWEVPLERLIRPEIRFALQEAPAEWVFDHKQLMAGIPEAEFFEVRLFQILKLQGRWRDA